MIKKVLIVILFLFVLTPVIHAAVEDYLILGDIGPYKLSSPQSFFPGEPPIGGPRVYDRSGIVAATGHFPDHMDKTYEVMYIGGNGIPSPTVQVTQHSGSESDKWLLHEVERDFRSYYGLPDDSFVTRQIDNHTVIALSVAGWTYRWISGNKIVQIQYHDPQMTKPEPIEVVRTYLAKHPSTLTAMTSADLRTADNRTKWIKDEMDRRLWLCDKWFEQLQLGKVEQSQVLQEAVKSMNVFLDYREKYYGMKAEDEKNTLQGYLDAKDETNIRNKLNEYKTWWSANKGGSLIGILSVYAHRAYNQVSSFFTKLFSFLTTLWERLRAIFG